MESALFNQLDFFLFFPHYYFGRVGGGWLGRVGMLDQIKAISIKLNFKLKIGKIRGCI